MLTGSSSAPTLRDLTVLTKDGEWGSGGPAEGLSAMRVIRGTDFAAARFGEVSRIPTRYVRADIAERKVLIPGDILIETAGGTKDQPTGRTLLVTEALLETLKGPSTCASFARFIRPDRTVVESGYLFWFLQFLYATGEMSQHQVQHTGVARFQYTKFAERQRVPLPPLPEQRAIAHILGTLDDKIELNRRTNETLEAMARALFKSWFVDFDPVHAKKAGRKPEGMDAETAALFPDDFHGGLAGSFRQLPKGWIVATAGWLGHINRDSLTAGTGPSQVDYVEISEVSRGNVGVVTRYERGSEPSRARRRARHGDTVLSTVRPDRGAYFLVLDPPDTLVLSTGFAVVSSKDPWWAFLHVALTTSDVFEELGRVADGGAYPAVRPAAIAGLMIPSPLEPDLRKVFHQRVEPMLRGAELRRKESQTLAALRDALLPQLLSGSLRVPEAMRLVEKVV